MSRGDILKYKYTFDEYVSVNSGGKATLSVNGYKADADQSGTGVYEDKHQTVYVQAPMPVVGQDANGKSGIILTNSTLAVIDLGKYTTTLGDVTDVTANYTYRQSYNVTKNYSHLSDNTGSTMSYTGDHVIQFTPDTGYSYPTSVTVKAGTSTLTQGTHYTYSSTTGKLTILHSEFDKIRKDITVTAAAVPNTYTVTLDDNGGSGGDGTVTATYDKTMPSPVTTPTRIGYLFKGYWGSRMSGGVLDSNVQFYNANGTANSYTYTLTEDSTFTAGWDANTITMYLDHNGGVGGAASFDVKYDATALEDPFTLPTRTGYTLTGFYSGTGTGAVKVVNANCTLVSNASGYTESGKWKRTENGTLYAQWTPLTPTVTLDKNSQYATNGNKTSVTATYDAAMPALTATGNLPTRPGYTFDGYWTAKTGGTQYYNGKGESVKTADFTKATTLYAHWKANDYTITFNANGGKGSTSASVTYDAAYPTGIQPPTRSGHIFLGYYSGNVQYYNPEMQAQKTSHTIAGDLALTAKWQPLEYTINYYDGSIYLTEQEATYGTPHTIKTAEDLGISKDNYTLVGWADNPNLSTYNYAAGQVINYGLVTDPEITFVDLYAIWMENDKFTVSYNTNGGMAEGLPVPSFEYSGTEITVTDVIPTSAGYDFKGWVSSVDGSVLEAGDTIIVDNANITLTAKWEKIPVYTLTYNANGGMGAPLAEEIRQNTSADVNFNSTPQKVGYTFLGYAESSDATAADYTADGTKTITMDSDKTLYAVWEINTYSITMDQAAGVVIEVTDGVTTVEHGGEYSFTVTVDDKHDGSAMTAAVNGAVQALAGVQDKVYTYNVSNVTEDQHITVSGLTAETYSVTLYLNGGQLDAVANVSSYSYGAGKALPTVSDISKKGYTFEGWYESSDFSGDAVTEITATDSGDKVFWAKWTPNTYSIAFDGNGATAGATESIANVTYDTPAALTANGFTKDNSYFMGWSDNADATFPKYSNGETVMNLAESGAVTLYAVWSGDNKYYVTYNANGGTGGPTDNSTYYVDEEVTASEAVKPVRDGYTFAGWATSPDSSDTVESAKMVAGGLTFYAVWAKNATYTVSYHPNGGEGSIPVDVTAYEAGDAVTVGFMPLPKKLGYTFAGWAAADNADTPEYTENGTKEFEIGTENVTLYAVWEPITYTIKYNGVSAPADQTMTYDKAEALTAPTSNPGHQFKGWAGSEGDAANGIVRYADGQEVKNLASTQDAVIELYAVWTPAVTTIVFDFDGGSGGTSSASVNYGEALPASLSAPTRYGYRFMGYYIDQVQYYDSDMESAMAGTWNSEAVSVTFKAVWEGVDYTIRYVNGDTQLGVTTPATYGTPFALETAETLGLTAPEGKRFAGWSIWSGSESVAYTDGQQITTGLTNVDGDIVHLYAVWTDIETYKVTYNANGGQGIPSDPSAYQEGSAVGVLFDNDPALTGYTFAGWSKDSAATTAEYTADGTNSFDMPAEDVTLYAVWNANKYSVQYFADASSDLFATDDFTYGASGELNNGEALSKDGYTFAGWSLTSGGTVSYLGGQQIINLSVDNGAVINLYAVWTANEVEVTFDANGGSVAPESLGYTYGESYRILPTPSREGYTFLGWFNGDDEVKAASIVTESQAHTLTAKWTANVYSITLRTNEGTINEGNVTSYTCGVGATLPTDVTKTGFTFGGWFTDSSLEGNAVTEVSATDTGDKVFYAKWVSGTDVAYTVEHYKETLTGTFEMAEDENGIGVTGGYTAAEAKEYEGFTVHEPIMQETIKADGTTVVKIYYTRNSYTLTFKPENGERDYVYTLKYGAPITAPTVVKDGNAFDGWDTEVAQTMPAEDLTYTAQWTVNMFVVTLPTDEEQANAGYAITVSSTPDDTVSGKYAYGSEYSFTISAVGDTDISGMLIYVNNVALSAGQDDVYRFAVEGNSVVTTRGVTAGKHSVSYNPNGGKGVPYDPASYAAGETVTLIFDAYVTRNGYTFLGWDTDKDAVTPTYTKDAASTLTMQESNVELYAIWLRNIGIDVTDSDGASETVENGEYVITYDGEVHTLSLAAESGIERVTYQWYKDGTVIDGANTASITVKNVADSGVYRCDVTYSQDGTLHSDSATITVTINRALLTVVATDMDVVYGEETPNFAYTFEGLLGEDGEAVITGEVQCTTDRLIDSDVGDYTITVDVSGLMTADYTIAGQNGTLTVTPRTVTIAWPKTTRFAYSADKERSFEATLGNIYGEDVVTAVMGGDWKMTEIGEYTAMVTGLAGDDAGNYQLPDKVDASWEIYQRSTGGFGGGGYVETYKVIVSEDIVNGEVTSSVKTAKSGATVTITVKADTDYELESLTVTDKKNKAVETTEKADGKYTFKMPASDVTVNAQFKEIEKDDNTGHSSWSGCPKDSTCPIYPFTDAEPTAWYHDGVHFCIDNEYMQGYPDGTFQPCTATSRAMIVTMLWRMEGSPETEYEHGFTDVKPEDWYADAITWGAENGIITGYGNGVCAADDVVTREQMAALFYRYAELKGIEIKSDDSISTSDYTDADAISDWAEPMMEWACGSGLIKGMDDNTLAPQGNTTRAQVATMFVRFCEFILN